MELKIGDLVAFKKYENMTEMERSGISEDSFPEFGKVSFVYNESERFFIEGEPYAFDKGSIDYIIVKAITDDIHIGDEVLVKTKVESTHDNLVWLSPLVFKNDVVEVLNHKEEHFIVQEDQYKMYVIDSKTLSLDKSKAKIYNSRIESNNEAADMHLNAWEVIPYE